MCLLKFDCSCCRSGASLVVSHATLITAVSPFLSGTAESFFFSSFLLANSFSPLPDFGF